MNFRRLISRLFAVLVIIGLVATPLMTPAAAKLLPVGDIAAMSGDMPCCPDGQKNNNCQDCPLIAMCMLTIAQAEPPSTSGIQAPMQISHVIFALDDLMADGLIGAPPDHPPRTSI